MIEVRCKLCNTELKSHPTQTRCCGCTNMVTVVGDKITALDLSKVVMISTYKNAEKKYNMLTDNDLLYQESRRLRKVKKLNFEIR